MCSNRDKGRVAWGTGEAVIPAMPNFVPAELSTWLEVRHADLFNGDNNRI